MHWHKTTPQQQAKVAELATKCGLTLVPVARYRDIPRRYRGEQPDLAWRPGTKTIYYAEDEGLNILYTALHEIGHWFAATSYERRLINWGYNLKYADFPPPEREVEAAVISTGLTKAMGFAKDACYMLYFYSIRDRSLLACTRKAKVLLRANNIRLKGVRP
jgi:hypothetical protein